MWIGLMIGLSLLAAFLVLISIPNILDTIYYFEPCNPHLAYSSQMECICPTSEYAPFGYSVGNWMRETDGWHCYYFMGGGK